jgi:GntR family transcriptional regulator
MLHPVGRKRRRVASEWSLLYPYKSMTSLRFAAVAQELRERIALGDYGALGSVESEAQLCRRYAVSRPTVRRALEQLRDEGLVEARHGAGWFVVGSAFHQRLALGTFRHADSAVAESGKLYAATSWTSRFRPAPGRRSRPPLRMPDGGSVLHARSVRTVDGDGLDVAHEWVPGSPRGSAEPGRRCRPGHLGQPARDGHAIATVRQTITAGLASGRCRPAGTATGVPLLLVRRVATGADGIPLALSDHRYLAHRFALEVEFNSGPFGELPRTPRPTGRANPR